MRHTSHRPRDLLRYPSSVTRSLAFLMRQIAAADPDMLILRLAVPW
jgi:hypothetical protein